VGNWSASRLELGDQFNEGARLLWLALKEREWSQWELRKHLTGRDDEPLSPGVVSRWLYGDRRPSLRMAIQIRDLLEVPIEAWHADATEVFTPPAGEDDELPAAANGDG
jgi:transcriptional regulator with XRE-family HTH domain